MKILVVDDEALLVKGIRFNLQNEGYEVITGSDGLEAVQAVREQNPDLEIYLQSCVAEWQPTFGDGKKNQTIRQYNTRLKTYAQEHGCHFVDIAPYAEDHIGAMATPYSMDRTIHLNEDGCVAWMKALAAYANWQMSNEKE